ncbi:ATP-dependent DNA helicase tlh1 [Colletotrichum fructicola Nara gc5]|uniref:ATP-dependent DNA helicase tlh1 n=1 Tax=Colletotrichum fructicola (strain Nara gc5) TaxID=1213859 RepID=A0A7J6JTD4_COLFN|nr:ATP-dependent DNA helicase tlh1 [Colletotrichum fructicola Nara gc5]
MAFPSPPPSSPQPGPMVPHSLTDKQRRRLEALQLHFNEPEPVLICRPCGYALKPFGERVSRHLAEKHEVPKPQRRGLSALVKSLQLGDPNDVALRPDGLPPHEALTVTRGHACRRCSYRTASDDLICRHIAKSHGVKGLRKTDGWQRDHIRSGVLLQSWSQNGARGFWIAQPTAAGSTTPRETGTPDADDVPAAQHALLAAAHDAERAHLAGGLRATASATGPVDIAFQTGWMRRTGWDLMFDGARRDFLVKMSELPDAGRHVEDDMPLASPPEDEARLRRIVSAVDGVFNRCEDTIRSMDISMRCWLRSTEPHRPYKAPFELVGRQATTYKYRSLVKRLLCFCIRLWRLPLGTRLSQCRRSLTIAQSRALDALWSDELWNTPRPDEAAAAASPARSGAVLAHGEAADADGRRVLRRTTRMRARGIPSHRASNSPAGGDLSDDESDRSAAETDDESDFEDLVSEGWEDFDGFGHEDANASSHTDTTEDGWATDATASPPPFPDWSPAGGYFSSALEDLTLRLLYFLMTEEFEDGQSKSTLLVYFGGVLGLTSDGSGFRRPGNYTASLSAFIYCARLVVVEVLLPWTSHDYVSYPARPRSGQLDILNRVRRETMCLGSQAPIGEFLSLRAYGRVLATADGPSFRFDWSDDGQTISWDDGRLSLQQFRSLAHKMVETVAAAVERLMYGWHPVFDLSKTKDRMVNTHQGYSFVSEPANGLQEAYLDLSQRACLSKIDGLLSKDGWVVRRVQRYINDSEALLSALFALIHLTGGQAARGSELTSVQYQNGTSTPRGVYIHSGALVLITRHHKTRHTTNNEFQVARFLPTAVGRLLYLYLVYIRPFTSMLTRVCLCAPDTPGTSILFASHLCPDTPWSTGKLSKELMRSTTQFTGQPINTQTYRQLSIAITERHVKQIHTLFDQYDDRSRDAPVESAFAWQSGHRPFQRAITYGLDGAYPDSLQPALLDRFRWVSRQWHSFLRLEAPDHPTCATTQQIESAPPQSEVSSIPAPHATANDGQSTTRKRQESPIALAAPTLGCHHPNKRIRFTATSGPKETTTHSVPYISNPQTEPDPDSGSEDTSSVELQHGSIDPGSPQPEPGTRGGNKDTHNADPQKQDTIEPFVFNAEFSIAICKKCRSRKKGDRRPRAITTG